MKVAYLGSGTWGFCLASLLAGKGHTVTSWTKNGALAELLNSGGEHPHLAGQRPREGMSFTTDLERALDGAELIVESVTAAGIRPVLTQLRAIGVPSCSVVITSKGIEQDTGLILPDVACEILGEQSKKHIGILSGPGYAKEVICGLPTSVVASAYNTEVMLQICEAFTTPTFRVYPNSDISGVAYGGALKNIIAIACGISDGLSLGSSSKAALMTRGLHEMRKLAMACGSKLETLYGLSGMGDMCLTCCSMTSRNTQFGYLLAQGLTLEEAEKKIDMVVEGAYTCISALQLCQQHHLELPITEIVHKIIYGGMKPSDAVKALMQRSIKEEHL